MFRSFKILKIRTLVLLLFIATPVVSAFGDGLKKPKVAAIVFLENQQYFHILEAGYRDASKKSGINLMLASSELNLDTETHLINSYISMGVKALIISPFHQKKSIPAIKKAFDKGIKVVISSIPVQSSFPHTTVSSNDYNLGETVGRAASEYISTRKNNEAKVAVLAFDDREPAQSEKRVKGFCDQLRKHTDASIILRENAWDKYMSIRVTTEILRQNPQIDIIFAANEGGLEGAVMAVKLAGKAKQIKVFGIDSSKQITQMLLSDDDILQAVSVQRPYVIATRIIEETRKLIDGEKVPSKIYVPGFLLSRKEPGKLLEYRDYLNEVLD